MKKNFELYAKVLSIAVLVLIITFAFTGCNANSREIPDGPYFASAPMGLSEDTRIFSKIADERMVAENTSYKGYIFKDGGDAFCFRLKSPDYIVEGKTYPFIMFLHGYGDLGDDNSAHMYASLINSVKTYAPENCYVFMPQSVKDYDWSENGLIAKKGGIDILLNKCLDELIATLNVDKTRIYITGMSMGGLGTLWQAAKYPDKYAAAMPVCGVFYEGKNVDNGKLMIENVNNLKNIPIWFFHATKDPAVDFSNSVKLSEYLKNAGNPNIKATWFNSKKHDITSLAYDNVNVWNWLFAQKKT